MAAPPTPKSNRELIAYNAKVLVKLLGRLKRLERKVDKLIG